MKAHRYREIAAGAVVQALVDAGDRLGPIASVEVDGIPIDALHAQSVYVDERAKAFRHRTGGNIAQTVDAITGKTAGKLAETVEGLSRRVRQSKLSGLIPHKTIDGLKKRVRLDPERVSSRSLVEIRFEDGRLEPFAVEALNLDATVTLQRASLLAETGSSAIPTFGAALPAATALTCALGAIRATVRGDMPHVKAFAATTAKQVVLAGVSLLPIEPVSPAAAVIDARNLQKLKKDPTIAHIVHLGANPLDDQGVPILPERVPHLELRPVVKRLLARAIPDKPDESVEAREQFVDTVRLLEESGALTRDAARTLRELVKEWRGFGEPDKWHKLLDRTVRVKSPSRRCVGGVVGKLLDTGGAERPFLVAINNIVTKPAFRSRKLSADDRASILRHLSLYTQDPARFEVLAAVDALISSPAFQRIPDHRLARHAPRRTRQRMLRTVCTLARIAGKSEGEDAKIARDAVSRLSDVRWDFGHGGKHSTGEHQIATPRKVVGVPVGRRRLQFNYKVIQASDTRLSDPKRVARLLSAFQAGLADLPS